MRVLLAAPTHPDKLYSHNSEEKYSSSGMKANVDVAFLCRSLAEYLLNCSLRRVAR